MAVGARGVTVKAEEAEEQAVALPPRPPPLAARAGLGEAVEQLEALRDPGTRESVGERVGEGEPCREAVGDTVGVDFRARLGVGMEEDVGRAVLLRRVEGEDMGAVGEGEALGLSP